ncbi:unnamed protein product, partial [marine sediment metagenome]
RSELADQIVEKVREVERNSMGRVHDCYIWAQFLGPLGARKQTFLLLRESKYLGCCYGLNLVESLAQCGTIEDVPALIDAIDKETDGASGVVNKALQKLTGVKMPLKDGFFTDKVAWQNWWKKNKDKTDVQVEGEGLTERNTSEKRILSKTVRQMLMPNGMRSPRDFSWFPDSQKIAIRLAQRIVVVEVESGKIKILSEPNVKHCNPACAPDGKTIAYIGPMGEHSTIWVMDINGENKKPLVNVRCWHRPVWSADGKHLVFTERNNDIWVVNADGSGLKQLTS